ncbi:metallophosphoesterase [Paenibacillus sp. FSL H7-0331]|uniref:metallophosphoesterase family protein n=1 Tax=Paenibacillus sp. FSL H7-0331 TaxID=1920421 RepID=UPI00096D1F43|nr:metallophosphoesterase [Paenibacillus sp. FSL H7-0331]OMF02682.1 hypothetical protein BK127_36895 [Paenibacillus sp. FSL H7-0331]
MRIVILGDFHIDPQYPELTVQAMADTAQVSPDLVIPLGDFGRNGLIGRPEGLQEAKRYLDLIGAPLRPIMGNHDLERESGCGVQQKGTMEEAFLQLFQLSEPYGVMEFAEWRLFFASTEPQPEDSCYDVQECYATDHQFQTLVSKLKERPGVPVLFFTHAPPIGSGLRTVPRVHVRSTNAYLDQNHDPYRWLELVKKFPEIVMWFSAHYHLSHSYPDSHTHVYGTHFFLNGVHGPCTRDGKRQSRVIDIGPGGVTVRTLDHVMREITEEGRFEWYGTLSDMMTTNSNAPVQPVFAGSSSSVRLIYKCPIGEGAPLLSCIAPISNGRYLVATAGGYSWEVEPATTAVLGTLHIGPALRGIAAADGIGWLAWDRHIGYSQLSNPWRFVRREDDSWPKAVYSFKAPVEAIAPKTGGHIWVSAAGWLWEAFSTVSGGLETKRLARLPEPCKQLTASGEEVWLTGLSGALYAWHAACDKLIQVREQVAAWDSWKGEHAALIPAKSQYEVETGLRKYPIPITPAENDAAQIMCLGQDTFLLTLQEKAYLAGARFVSPILLNDDSVQVYAISRSIENSCQFAVSAAMKNEGTGWLQIWKY